MDFQALLVSTYELGRQPFGLASPAAWLSEVGVDVDCLDLSLEKLDERRVRRADLVAFYLPMHTATRIASRVIPEVRKSNPHAHLCAYGLYAPVNADFLKKLGIQTILGGEFEQGLQNLARRLRQPAPATTLMESEPLVSLGKQKFLVPERIGLPVLEKYARLNLPDGSQRLVGYTEASRGCKHHCRHCPIVPVYDGKFRVVQRDVVLQDIRQQVALGAEHITTPTTVEILHEGARVTSHLRSRGRGCCRTCCFGDQFSMPSQQSLGGDDGAPVSADDRRFLILAPSNTDEPGINVVVNWDAGVN
jgi:radical SAM superfamily enzyme YgiQ (UPF0313 family)